MMQRTMSRKCGPQAGSDEATAFFAAVAVAVIISAVRDQPNL
jgi:hypothetical protein